MKTSTNASGSDSDGSSFSSFCSSFVKTTISDNSSLEGKKNLEVRRVQQVTCCVLTGNRRILMTGWN